MVQMLLSTVLVAQHMLPRDLFLAAQVSSLRFLHNLLASSILQCVQLFAMSLSCDTILTRGLMRRLVSQLKLLFVCWLKRLVFLVLILCHLH
nr:hypothetical protein Iba_scaffold29754CG0020 [Ipomoea batatas]